MSKLKILKVATLSLLLAACGSESEVNRNNNSTSAGSLQVTELKSGIKFDAYATIPFQPTLKRSLSGLALDYRINLNNYTENTYKIDKINFIKANGDRTSDGIDPNCGGNDVEANILSRQSSCVVMIRPQLVGDMILEAQLSNQKNPEEKPIVKQFIRVSDLIVPAPDDVFLMKDDVKQIIVGGNRNYEYSISMTLLKDVESIEYQGVSSSCSGKTKDKLKEGLRCDLRISGTAKSNIHPVNATVTAIIDGKRYHKDISTLVRVANTPHILMSYGAQIDLAKGEKETRITLYNSGTVAAKNLTIKMAKGDTIAINNLEACKNLEVEHMCELRLRLKDPQLKTNIADYIEVKYIGINGEVSNSAPVSIIGGKSEPQLIFSVDSLENIIVGETKTVKLTIQNNGINLKDTDIELSKQVAGLNITNNTCRKDSFLEEDLCSLDLTYSPQESQNTITVGLEITGGYDNELGLDPNFRYNYPIKVSSFIPGSVIVPADPKDPVDSTKPIEQESGVTLTEEGAVIKLIGNNIESKTAILAIKNTSSAPTIIKGIKLSTNDNGKLQLVEPEKNCLNKTLKLGDKLGDDTCLIKVKYGPTKEEPTTKDFGVIVEYDVIANSNVLVAGSLTLPIKVIIGEFAEVRALLSVSGAIRDPNNSTKYGLVIGKTVDRAILTYTFTNNGNANQLLEITNFKSTFADYSANDSNCDIEKSTLLAAGKSCVIVLKAPSQKMLDMPGVTGSTKPGFDYGTIVDPLQALYTNTDGSLTSVEGTKVAIDYDRIWIKPTYEFSIESSVSEWVVSVKITKSSNDVLSDAITFKPSSLSKSIDYDPFAQAIIRSCALDGGNDSCTATITFPAAYYDSEKSRARLLNLYVEVSRIGYYDIIHKIPGRFSLDEGLVNK